MRLIISEMPCRVSSAEAERDHEAYRPAQQAAGIRRHLTVLPGSDKAWPGEPHQEQTERQQEHQRAEKIDPRAPRSDKRP